MDNAYYMHAETGAVYSRDEIEGAEDYTGEIGACWIGLTDYEPHDAADP